MKPLCKVMSFSEQFFWTIGPRDLVDLKEIVASKLNMETNLGYFILLPLGEHSLLLYREQSLLALLEIIYLGV